MNWVSRFGVWGFLLLAMCVSAFAEDLDLPLEGAALPPGWTMQSEVRQDDKYIPDYEARNGGQVEWMATQYVNVFSRTHQMHTVFAATEEDAKKIEASRAKGHGEDFVRRQGRHVLEIVGGDRDFAARLWALLELGEKTATWSCVFDLACIETCDAAELDVVAWRFGKLAFKRGDEALQKGIEEAVADWTLGQELTLPTADWKLRPDPTETANEGRLTRYTFPELPALCSVPHVDARADLEVAARYSPAAGDATEAQLAATDRWPTADPAVLEAAAQAAANSASAREKVLSILAHMDQVVGVARRPSPSQVPEGGRALPPAVLERGEGSALERCDLFVTLCRASGVAARQVAGWRPDLRRPHVWAEVHLTGEGWIPVDPATVWLGTSTRYIPLCVSEDGALPLLNVNRPRVRKAEGSR